MKRGSLLIALLLSAGCAAAPATQPIVPDAGPFPEVVSEVSSPSSPAIAPVSGRGPTDAAVLTCSSRILQGGLIICQTRPGLSLTLDGVPVTRADDRGIAVVGVSRGQPEKAVIGLDLPLDQPAPFGFRGARAEVEVAPRKDGVSRFVMACGKIAPQTEAEARHAALSEEKKRQALETPRPPIGEVSFVAPATGPYSSPFGAVRTYVPDSSACEGRTSVHNGLDIAVPTGAQVRAPAAGEVVLADPDLYFEGGAVFIDHGRGLMSVLMHMSRLDVRTGERVAQGQALGLSGATGRVTGPHVHWGLKYRNGITNDRASDLWIDPSTVLTGSGADR